MIRYTLRCDHDHRFDSWFQSAAGFDKLKAAGMVACAVCGSVSVEKSLMAPAVRPARTAVRAEAAAVPAARPLAAPASPAEAALAALRAHIEANSEHVGLSFAAEARAIHEGRAPDRAIHGEATPAEARALIEEGLPVAALPLLPARKTN